MLLGDSAMILLNLALNLSSSWHRPNRKIKGITMPVETLDLNYKGGIRLLLLNGGVRTL